MAVIVTLALPDRLALMGWPVAPQMGLLGSIGTVTIPAAPKAIGGTMALPLLLMLTVVAASALTMRPVISTLPVPGVG